MKNIIKSLVIVVAVAAVASVATWAVFSDQESIPNNTIATGTLALTLNHSAGKPFSVSNAFPGYLSGWEYMDIYNTGSLPFEAYMSVNQTGPASNLWDYIRIEMKTVGWDSDCTNGDGGEQTIYNGLAKNFTPQTLVSTLNFWHLANESDASGSPADNVRPGYSERICQRVGVDNSADNSVQGTSATFEEVVDALQDND